MDDFGFTCIFLHTSALRSEINSIFSYQFMKRTNLICTVVFELCVQLEVRVDLPFSSRSSVPSRRDGVSEVLVKGVSLAGVGLVSCQTVKMDRFPN